MSQASIFRYVGRWFLLGKKVLYGRGAAESRQRKLASGGARGKDFIQAMLAIGSLWLSAFGDTM